MANPQKENGYTPIANEILEQLVKLSLNGSQWRIMVIIWRYTYGFSRIKHKMSLSFISKALNVNRTQVKRELDKLIEFNIISVVSPGSFNSTRELKFNKDFDAWNIQACTLNSIQDIKMSTVSETEYEPVLGLEYEPVLGLEYQERNKTKSKTSAYTCEFEEFYKQYPRAEEKRRTFNNWKKCIKDYTAEQLIASCINYSRTKDGTEKQFLKTSANFLGRDKIFEDYINVHIEEAKKPMAGGISF